VVARDLQGRAPGITGDIFDTTEALTASQRSTARPLYDAMDTEFIRPSPLVDTWLNSPEFQSALREGVELERLAQLKEGRVFEPASMGIDPGRLTVLNPQAPNLRILDTVKQGLDKMIEGETKDFKLTKRGFLLNQLKNAFVDEVDRLDTNGVWKKARDAWSGPIESKKAMDFGKRILERDVTPGEVRHMVTNASKGDQEFMKHGLAQEIITRFQSAGIGADESKLLAAPWVRNKLAPLFPGEGTRREFFHEMDLALQRFATKQRTMGGSPTAERLAEDSASYHNRYRTQVMIAYELARGNVLGTIGHLYQYWRNVGFNPNDEMNEAVARILFGVRIPEMPTLAEASGQLTEAGKVRAGSVIPDAFNPGRVHPLQANVADPATYLSRQALPRLLAPILGEAAGEGSQ